MKGNKKVFVLGIFILTLAWAGNLWYFYNHQLSEPLFLKHFYELRNMEQMEIYYVDNASAKDTFFYISFPQIHSDPLPVNVSMSSQNGKYYKINRMSINLNHLWLQGGKQAKDLLEKDPVLLTRMLVQNSKGKHMEVDIGKVYLTPSKQTNKSLKTQSTFSSNNNSGGVSLKAEDTVEITNIETSFLEELCTYANVSINNLPIKDIPLPIKLESGDTLAGNYAFNFNDASVSGRMSVFNIHLYLSGTDSKGESTAAGFYIHSMPYYFRTADIEALRAEKGGK